MIRLLGAIFYVISWPLATLGITGSIWIYFWFGPVRFEQFIFHAFIGSDAVQSVDLSVLFTGVIAWAIAPTIALVASIAWLRNKPSSNSGPRGRKQLFRLPAITSISALVLSVGPFGYVTGLPGFIQEQTQSPSSFISERYVDPEEFTIATTQQNLVLIYVEGLEETHGLLESQNTSAESLIEPLLQATSTYDQPPGFEQAEGAGWTIAAIVASQCAVPYRPVSWIDFSAGGSRIDGNRLGQESERFLPGISCLGDVLQKSGYQNVFLGGARKAFAGKGKFFAEHGYQTVLGWEEWEAIGEEGSSWGLHDDRLFSYARDTWRSLEAGNTPYNLTLLTLDTHHPSGHPSESCTERTPELKLDLERGFRCVSEEIAAFLDYGNESGFLDDTVVVVTGDHLAMAGQLSDQLDQQGNRNIFVRFSPNPETAREMKRTMFHFDLLPSILDRLGAPLPDGRAGIGLSVYRDEHPSHFAEHPDFESLLNRFDQIYEDFWKAPDTS